MARALVLLAALAASACGALAENVVTRGKAARMLPRFATCPDHDPIRLLLDRHCPGGVCGYSCLPRRWDAIKESTQ